MSSNKKSTSTKNIVEIIKSSMVNVVHVDVRYSSHDLDKEIMNPNDFIEALEFLNESGIFADAVGWKYEIVHVLGGEDYVMVHGGQMAPYMICTVHAKLKANNDTNIEDIVKKLNETIFTQMSA